MPPITQTVFLNGITHPELWLWDSWGYNSDEGYHLFTLALARESSDGDKVYPNQRNDHEFHIREFITRDSGYSWQDIGQKISMETPGIEALNNIWSGSALITNKNDYLFGFTGIIHHSPQRQFIQSIRLAQSNDPMSMVRVQDHVISCPLRDYEQIIDLGYYLGPKQDLGSIQGEEGGPILAWRDPFLFGSEGDKVQVLWSAKMSPKTGCVAHASLVRKNGIWKLDALHAPITLPDAHLMTQAEVPKLYSSPDGKEHLLLISACDRLYEGQPDSEVTKKLRLYRADNIRGPWRPAYKHGSEILNLPDMFGATIMNVNWPSKEISLICPITEMAEEKRQLTIAPIQTVKF